MHISYKQVNIFATIDNHILLYSLHFVSKIDNLNDRGGVTSTVVAGEESEVACEEYRCCPWWLVMNTVHKSNNIIKIYIL